MCARGLPDRCSANTAAGPAARFELRDPLCVGTRFAGPALRWDPLCVGTRFALGPALRWTPALGPALRWDRFALTRFALGPALRWDPLCVGTRFALGPALRWDARCTAVSFRVLQPFALFRLVKRLLLTCLSEQPAAGCRKPCSETAGCKRQGPRYWAFCPCRHPRSERSWECPRPREQGRHRALQCRRFR